MKLVSCPRCQGEGLTYRVCPQCEGEGCDFCTEGEITLTCSTCNGLGKLSDSYVYILRGADFVFNQDPRYDGSERHPGVTIYSLADFALNRWKVRGRTTRMRMRVDHPEFDLLVECYDCHNNVVEYFTGFAWGYGGEGPHGLAAVMTEVFPHRFECMEDALREIARHPMTESWEYA